MEESTLGQNLHMQPAVSQVATGVIRLGVIGLDSLHVPEFSRRVNTMHAEGQSRCQVTRFWGQGPYHMPEEDVRKWRLDTVGHGVRPAANLESMLDEVDGVMVLSVNGRHHLQQAIPAIERGLPTYIDKPLTCDLTEAREILAAATQYGTRCYSASSLRFADEITQLNPEITGKVVALDAFGPGNLNDSNPGVFYYGVHTIEMVDAIWGGGVAAVSATHKDARTQIALAYHDGRVANIRLERVGKGIFGATVHGLKGVTSFAVNFDSVYDRMVAALVGFFEGKPAPVALEDTVENIAVMAAANASIAKHGQWIPLN